MTQLFFSLQVFALWSPWEHLRDTALLLDPGRLCMGAHSLNTCTCNCILLNYPTNFDSPVRERNLFSYCSVPSAATIFLAWRTRRYDAGCQFLWPFTLDRLFYFGPFCKTNRITDFQRLRRLYIRNQSLQNVRLLVVLGSDSTKTLPISVDIWKKNLFHCLRTWFCNPSRRQLLQRAGGFVLLRFLAFSFEPHRSYLPW